MHFTEQDKLEAIRRLQAGDRQGAVNYIRQKLSVTDAEAEQLVRAIEVQPNTPSAPAPIPQAGAGCAGCISGFFKIGAGLFFVLTLIFGALAAITYYLSKDEMESLKPVSVQVTETYNEDSTYVEKTMVYEWEGQTFTLHSSGMPDTLQVGDSTIAMINPSDPSQPFMPEDLWENFMYFFIGAALFTLFVSLILWTIGRFVRPRPVT